ncbi:hypothetical protein CGMCC3_g733 [Colletotrichum fructicola]|uniref:Uncharacterized protein n=1 Tax=Colletotrichum fructicola (strain Nara gc5) TaxID=1213859 RepID=A0A7J6J6K6_COLFN|nr:uncharacterized protein CGMCC3_g733 [Colletotrichum fructicola]KAE9583049.1 hypothetical protein CGMCC3_g733 [Colletotrichum fructicola]KAF4485440.1 hypothetical protein CGGC5_v007037 [Colletotrichum fructicola Nara gc5]
MNAPGALIAAAGRLSLEKTTCDAEVSIAARKENITTCSIKIERQRALDRRIRLLCGTTNCSRKGSNAIISLPKYGNYIKSKPKKANNN